MIRDGHFVVIGALVAAGASGVVFERGSRVETGVRAVEGVVRFQGAAPAATPVDMSGDPYCARVTASTPVVTRAVEVGADGGLASVIVYVKGRVADAAAAAPAEPVVLDQKSCMYQPGVIALRVGQTLVVRNSDETMHNVHVRAKANRSFNLGQPRVGLESRRTFTAAEVGITVSCDVHGWMAGAIAVFDHPYFAVTAADGRFTLNDLPAGEYEIEAWHPELGAQTTRISVPPTGSASASFVFRGS